MEMVAEQKQFNNVLTKVLASIPTGFVFDDVYVIEQFFAEYPYEYREFCALYTGREKSMEMANVAIRGAIEQFEGVLIEEQKIKVLFPTLYSSLANCKVWKKI